jgi:hypothetical protein
MAKYKKKPVIIDAFRLGFDKEPDWFLDAQEETGFRRITKFLDHINPHITVYTLEGVMTAFVGDYIIRGIKYELYPCKSDIFESSYELVEE